MKWIIAALTASCLITTAFAQSGADPRTQEAATTARMTVDFSQAVAVAPQGGILEGWTATAPHDSMIKPIVSGGEYARIFSHGAFRLAGERAINLGYRLVVRLDRFPEVHAVEPYQDWSKWEAWVLEQARYWGHRAIYDIWNEPNIMTHWKGTREQYFEAYQRAHHILLKELGEAVQITGPSVTNTAGWNTDWMKPFLDYCLANKLKVPVLNWHELDGDGLRADEILLNLQAVYATYVNNPTYTALGMKRVLILEAFRTEHPGDILAEMYVLEKGGCDGAVNSCFYGDCEKQTLSGLLVNNAARSPRSSWFVYQAYAQGTRTRVLGNSSSIHCPVLASSSISSEPDKAQVLYGYWCRGSDPATADITLSLANLDKVVSGSNTSVKVTVHRLVSSNLGASGGFTQYSVNVYPVENGAITINHSGVEKNDVYRLVLEANPPVSKIPQIHTLNPGSQIDLTEGEQEKTKQP